MIVEMLINWQISTKNCLVGKKSFPGMAGPDCTHRKAGYWLFKKLKNMNHLYGHGKTGNSSRWHTWIF